LNKKTVTFKMPHQLSTGEVEEPNEISAVYKTKVFCKLGLERVFLFRQDSTTK